ncbi:MAG: MBOAT family O-acyltransferase, partial [Lepagella sp.]
YVDAVYNNLDFHNGTSVILATFFFTFQILCDFGGYSLIAIGAAMCMGFRLMQNFRQPYLALSPRDFWRRWHISLSSWFTEYVYIPLGGNRCSKARHAFNNMATMLISGLWHGANWTFVLWGGYHGILVTASGLLSKGKKVGKDDSATRRNNRFLSSLSKCIGILVTFVLMMCGWVFFRANNVGDAFKAFKKMATEPGMLFKGEGVPSILMALMLIGVLMAVELYRERRGPRPLPEHLSGLRLTRDIAYSALLVVAILLCGSFTGGQFIYFQF